YHDRGDDHGDDGLLRQRTLPEMSTGTWHACRAQASGPVPANTMTARLREILIGGVTQHPRNPSKSLRARAAPQVRCPESPPFAHAGSARTGGAGRGRGRRDLAPAEMRREEPL